MLSTPRKHVRENSQVRSRRILAVRAARRRAHAVRWLSGRKRRFAKPLYGLKPVPRVRIPASPPTLRPATLALRPFRHRATLVALGTNPCLTAIRRRSRIIQRELWRDWRRRWMKSRRSRERSERLAKADESLPHRQYCSEGLRPCRTTPASSLAQLGSSEKHLAKLRFVRWGALASTRALSPSIE